MKKILSALLFAGFALLLHAQTTPAEVSGQGDIGMTSDHWYLDGNTLQMVYCGNVCVTNARALLTCQQLTVNFPPQGSADAHPTNAVAETNLVLVFVDKKGLTNRLTADKGVYDHRVVGGATNEIFTFTGDTVRATNPQGWFTCKRLTVDLPPMGAANNHPTNAVAETNLVVFFVDSKHMTNQLTADKGIYNYSVLHGITNETFTFTGHATNTSTRFWATGEPLIWDVANNRFIATANFQVHFRRLDNGTNDSPVKF